MSIHEAYDPDTRGAPPVAPDDLPALEHTITPAAHYHRLVSKEQP